MAQNPFLESSYDGTESDTPSVKTTASRGIAPSKVDLANRARELGVDPSLALSIFTQESSGNWGSRSSNKGAVGGMQILPATYRAMMGTDAGLHDPWLNMEAGLRYLRHGQDTLKTNDPELLAAGYFTGYNHQSLKNGVIPNTDDGAVSTKEYARSVASRAGKIAGGSVLDTLNKDKPNLFSVESDPSAKGGDATLQQLNSSGKGVFSIEQPEKPSEGNIATDLAKNAKIGLNTAAQDLQELVGRIPVVGESIVKGADAVDEYFSGKKSKDLLADDSKAMQESMTPEMKGAMQKKWWDSDKGTFGEAWSDPRSYASGVVQSLPEQALTMIPAMKLAKYAYGAKIAAGATAEAASVAASRTAAIAGGVSEGLLGGAQSSREVRDQIMQLPPEVLVQSEAFKSLIDSGMDTKTAQMTLANDMATRAFVTSGVATGLFGGMGDRALAKIFTSNVSKSTLKSVFGNAAKGVVAEGLFEEAPQSALQQLSQNEALQKANPNVALTDDVANQALGGAVLGGLQGGGMGVLAGATRSPVKPVINTPSEAAGPLERATENAAHTPERVTVTAQDGEVSGTVAGKSDDGKTVQIVGDDGQVYNFQTGENGVTITPEKPDTPLTNAIHSVVDQEIAKVEKEVASEQAAPKTEPVATNIPTIVDPATGEVVSATSPRFAEIEKANQQTVETPKPEKPQTPKEPAKLDLKSMSDDDLNGRMAYLKEQSKAGGGWTKMLMDQRLAVENELSKRTKAPEGFTLESPSDTTAEKTEAKALPKELAGAKPTYAYGKKQFSLKFASDLDRAAYITAGEKPSKRDADYLKFAMAHSGMTEQEVREHGKAVREAIKVQAKTAKPGTIKIEAVTRLTKGVVNEQKAVKAVEAKAQRAEPASAPQEVKATKSDLDKTSTKFWKGETFRDIAPKVIASPDVSITREAKFSGNNLLDEATDYDHYLTDGRRTQKISKEVYDHIQSLKAKNEPSTKQPAKPTEEVEQKADAGQAKSAPVQSSATPKAEEVEKTSSVELFNSDAWNKEREDRIAESRAQGTIHLDSIPATVESMRGKKIFSVHDHKELGIIRTVDSRQNVYVNWSDKYSAEKNLATPSMEGKKQVFQTSLGKTDLKDYAILGEKEVEKSVERTPTAQEIALSKDAPYSLDLNKKPTGWKAVPIENGNGTVLVSADGKKALTFKSDNEKSGSEGLKAKAMAQAYAIDNPYTIEAPKSGEIKVQPIFEKPKTLAERRKESKASSKSEAPTKTIEDFGTKLGGAKKDQTPSLNRELTDDAIATEPFSKIWPPSEIDAIVDKYVAAVATAARAEVPAKPRVAYKVNRWVEKVKAVRDLAKTITSGAVSKEQFAEMLGKTSTLSNFKDKVDLLNQIDRIQWGRIGAVRNYAKAQTLKNGMYETTPIIYVEIDGKGDYINNAKTIDDVIDRVNESLGQEKTAKKMQFEVRGSVGKFGINKKGDSEYRKLKTFENSKEAFDYIRSNYDDLVKAWEDVKESDNVKQTDVRNAENRERAGADYRKGKDVTTEQFADTFSFRGIEFGNWVAQGKSGKERQGMLNQAYDALLDLADILGVPPKAMSLNGTMGLAFGSRGKGNASAHFEPDRLVINLTKTKGAGALAHEFFHALDNYFSRKRGDDYNFITKKPEPLYVHKTQRGTPITKARLDSIHKDNPSSSYYNPENWQIDPNHPQGVRPEVEERFAALVEALDNSPMKGRAQSIDKGKSDGYWGRVIERAARSFENYVIAKMMEKGYTNDYLANVTSLEDFPRSKERYPYLYAEELAPVAEAFDDLFATIKTKEDNGNIAMYARGNAIEGENNENNVSIQRESDKESKLLDDSGNGRRKNHFRRRGLGISDSIATKGIADIIGASAESPEDVADAAQVFRNPRYETFRVLFTSNGKIVGGTGISSRLPGTTAINPADVSQEDFYGTTLKGMMREHKADGYWIVHNHPTGDPTPSLEDIDATKEINKLLPGMRGHVIVNSNKFAVIRPNGVGGVIERNFGEDHLLLASKPHSLLGSEITKPGSVAGIAKSLQLEDGYVTLVGIDSNAKVRAIFDLSTDDFMHPSRAKAGIRSFARRTGSENVIAVVSDKEFTNPSNTSLISDGFLFDVVSGEGEQRIRTISGVKGKQYTSFGIDSRNGGSVVSAEQAPIEQSKTEAIFSRLEKGGDVAKNAEVLLDNMENGVAIRYIDSHFWDILEEADNSNLVEIVC